MDRRAMLWKVGVAATSIPLAGCSFSPFGCGEMHQTSVAASEAELTEAQRENLSMIEMPDLPTGERTIVRKAIRNDEYAECYPGSEELQSFVERVERRKAEQFENYEGTPPEYLNSVYVSEDGSYYRLSVTVEDEVV